MKQWRAPLVVLTVVLALVAAACGSRTHEVAPVEQAAADGAVETIAEPDPAEAEPEPVALPSGREAIAAAEGQAYALWFWGAH